MSKGRLKSVVFDTLFEGRTLEQCAHSASEGVELQAWWASDGPPRFVVREYAASSGDQRIWEYPAKGIVSPIIKVLGE